MNTFDIDFSDGTTLTEKSLDAAVNTAQQYIAAHPRTTARVFDQTEKAVAMVTATVVSTLDTDPGF